MTLADSSSFSPAVHPRAIRSGQQRYPADTHGYLDRVVGQSALPDLGLQTTEPVNVSETPSRVVY
jgi:hypothetical protein